MKNNVLRMSDLDLTNLRVLIREDFNVPIDNGKIHSDARLKAALPTLKMVLASGAAKLIMLSHLGRPKEEAFDPAYSLAPVADYLSEALDRRVALGSDLNALPPPESGDCVLLENVRFNPGESANDEALAQRYAELCDVFVMDAFGSAHRAQASTQGIAQFASIACAGPLLCSELKALEQALSQPKRPLVAIVGGSKVSTKIAVLERLSEIADQIILGGGIANTFIAAAGYPVGKSLHEPDWISQARDLMQKVQIAIPEDVICAKSLSQDTQCGLRALQEVTPDDCIFDLGPHTCVKLAAQLQQAGTILWNGPVGVFEIEAFSQGTATLGHAVAESDAFSIAGGGDTLAAIHQLGIQERISYLSTGGGAFLEFVEGKELPAVSILQKRAANRQSYGQPKNSRSIYGTHQPKTTT